MFCGAEIKPIKLAKYSGNDKIVISTCYFHNSELYFNRYDGRQMEYINGLIANIETFDLKIRKYTSNPEKWIYRVYIDETVLNISSLIHNIFNVDADSFTKDSMRLTRKQMFNKYFKKTIKNKTNNNFINEIDPFYTEIRSVITHNYNIFIFIEKLLTKYIDTISGKVKNSNDGSKYDNIEIMTYANPQLYNRLVSNPNKIISGEIATYGTLMRYHPLTDSNIAVVIMRNCSHTITPLDLIIQNYWIMVEHDKEFMEYVDKSYDFAAVRDLRGRKNWYMSLYYKSTNSKRDMMQKIRHFNYDRVMAGLISCKMGRGFYSSKHYENIFTELYRKLDLKIDLKLDGINSIQSKLHKSMVINNLTYDYGIDEAIINFIFPELRAYTYRNELKDTAQQTTIKTKTFAIKLINGESSSCGNCDKKHLLDLITEKYGKISKSDAKSTGGNPGSNPDGPDNGPDNRNNIITKKMHQKEIKIEEKNKNKCCLHEIYKHLDNTNSDDKPKIFKNKPFSLKYQKMYNIPWDINYLHSEPFKTLGINTWQTPKLSFITVLKSIMFVNNYIFSFRQGAANIPIFIRKTKTIKLDKDKDNTNIKETNKTQKSRKTSKKSKKNKKSSKEKTKKLTDKYLILCNVKKPDTDVDKYLDNLEKAYGVNNFYPVLLYPEHLTILGYQQNRTISFSKIIKSLYQNHGFQFNLE